MTRWSIAVAGLLATCTVTAPSPVQAATRYIDPTFQVDVQHDVIYGRTTTSDGQPVTLQLDLYTPSGDTLIDRPVYVYAHGGFFIVGDKADSTPVSWATRMAQRGYVAASINYRLGSMAVLAPVDTVEERQIVDHARADMQTAVRWFRANAAALGIDPDRIAVGGDSAGAVTALGVAIEADRVVPGDHADQSSAVCTAVSISGANDPVDVGRDDAGALFFHGSIDTVVPYSQAAATRDAMTAAGLPVQWIEFAGEGHSLTSESRAAMLEPAVRWLYDRVATAAFPCSPAIGFQPVLQAGARTPLTGLAGRSAVVSLGAVQNRAAGYVQALPCDGTPGEVSNLNMDAPDQIRSVLAIVPFDQSARACLFNQMRTHLIADLQGWFQPGAFDDVPDVRLVDTRQTQRPADGERVVITGRPDSTGVVSLVATDTTSAGYVQLLPCDEVAGGASNLNIDAAGQTRATLAFVRFDAAGRACVFVQRSVHVVVDLQGYMATGSFDDLVDSRLIDTRVSAKPVAGSITQITGRPDSTGVVMIVATETAAAGYVQALPCDQPAGEYSNLNVDRPGQTIAGLAFVHFDSRGTACLFSQSPTHLVADLQGYLAPGAFDDIADERVLDTRARIR
jgi:acetyl esterase/lipase